VLGRGYAQLDSRQPLTVLIFCFHLEFCTSHHLVCCDIFKEIKGILKVTPYGKAPPFWVSE
jgi:hypothetical protein